MRKSLLSLLVLMLLCVLPMGAAVQYQLNPEGFENGFPTTWTTETVSGIQWQVENGNMVNPEGAKEGLARIVCRIPQGSSSQYAVKLITPAMNTSVMSAQPQLHFSFAQDGMGSANQHDTLTVLYRTSATSEWKTIQKYSDAVEDWMDVVLDLPEYLSATAYQVAFSAYCTSGNKGVVLDAVSVSKMSECRPVENLMFEPMAQGAEFFFSGEGGTEFQVVVNDAPIANLANLDPVTAQVVYKNLNLQDTEGEISGLTPNTHYYAYVRSVCSDNESGYTDWVGAEFTTALAMTLPMVENFATKMPDGWQNLYGALNSAPAANSSSNKWVFSSNTSVTGSAHIYGQTYYNYSGGANYLPAWLVLPTYDISDLTAGTSVELTFQLVISGSSSSVSEVGSTYINDTKLHVLVSTDGGQNWMEINRVFTAADYSTLRRVRVDLSQYIGTVTSLKIALAAESTTSSAYFHIDDVTLHEYDGQCGDASNLVVVPMDVTAHATWNVTGKDDVVFQLSNTSTFATLLLNDTLTAHSLDLTDLTSATTYYARVKQLCEDAEWQNVTFTTAQGTPFAPVFTTTSIPNTWTRLSGTSQQFFSNSCTTTTSGWALSKNYVWTSSTNHWSSEIYSTTYNYWVVTPALYISSALEHVNLSFDMALTFWNSAAAPGSSSDDRVWVVISEDGGVTWDRANAVLWSGDPNDNPDYDYNAISTTGERVLINMDSYIGKSVKIAFGCETPAGGTDNRIHIHNISVRAYDPDCAGLTSLIVSADINEAVVNWTVGGTSHEALVHVSSNTNFSDTIAYATVSGVDTLLLNNLEANSQYYVRAIQNCSDFTWEDALQQSFKTHCQPDTIPYVTGFEDDAANSDPNCWTIWRASGSYPNVASGSTYRHDGTKCLTFGTSSAQQKSIAALPAFDEPVSGLEMSFWLRAYSASCTNTLEVGVMTNPLDTNTFVRIASFQPKSATYEQQFVSFNAYRGTGKYIAFRNTARGNYGFMIDDVDVHAQPSCLRMGEVIAGQVTAHGVTLGFDPTDAESYQIVLATKAINPDTLSQVSSDVIVYNQTVASADGSVVIEDATALMPYSTYYVYVRGICSETESGAWSTATAFTTLCDAYPVSAMSNINFNGTDALGCWTVGIGNANGMTDASIQSNQPSVSTVTGLGKVLMFNKPMNTESVNYGTNYYAIMPELDVDDIAAYQVNFLAAAKVQTANYSNIVVGVTVDPSDLTTFVGVDTLNISQASDSLKAKEYSVAFSNYMGYLGESGKYITFFLDAPADTTSVIYIDNVSVELMRSCAKINEVIVSNITSTGATISWTNAAPAFEVMLADTLCRNAELIGANHIILSEVVNAPVDSFVALSSNTLYFAYVRAICAEGDTSAWSSATVIKTALGVPFVDGFDSYSTYSDEMWKLIVATVPLDSVFSTANLSLNTTSTYKMSFQNVPTHITGMYGKAARTECYSSSYNSMLQSPAIDMTSLEPGTGVSLSLKLANVPYSGTSVLGACTGRELRIFISQDGGQTFAWADKVAEWNCDGTGDYDYNEFKSVAKKYTLDISAYAGQSISVLIASTSSVSSPDAYLYIDSIAINQYDNSCIGVTKINATMVNDEYVVTWNKTDAADTYYEVSTTSDFSTILMSDTVSVNTFTLSNWTYSTTYYVRAMTVCGSDWSTASFKTPLGVPYLEPLSAKPSTWFYSNTKASNVFAGTAMVSSTGGWTLQTSSVPAGMSNNMKVNIYGTSCAYWMVTPAIALPNTSSNTIQLSFDAAWTMYGSSSAPTQTSTDDIFLVAVSADGGATWNQADAFIWANDGNGNMGMVDDIPASATRINIDLTRFAGNSIAIGFYGESTVTGGDNDFHVANVSVRELVAGCDDPTNVTLSLVGPDTAVVAWTGDSLKASVVRLALDESFENIVLSDTVEAGFVDTIAGLAHGAVFYAQVAQLCDGDAHTAWINAGSAITTPCDPLEMPWAFDFANASSADMPICWTVVKNSGNYPYVSTSSHAIYMYGGGSTSSQLIALPEFTTPLNQLTLTMQYQANVSTSYGKLIVGTLDETMAESSFVALDTLDQIGTKADYELVLASAPADAKYLAIRYALGTSNYGTAYIYKVALDITPSCLPLAKLETKNVERRSMDIVWTPKVPANSYELVISTTQLTDSALNEAEKISLDTTAYHADGLVRNTLYYIYVRANCGEEDGAGAWSAISQRTTALNECFDEAFADGAATSQYFPFYGYYADMGFWTQMIYPETMMADLVGTDLSSLKFYISSGSVSSWATAEFQIALSTTATAEYTSAADIVPDTDLTLVYEGTVSAQNNVMTINFNQPFHYAGGNLVIDVYQVVESGFSTVYFYGITGTTNSSFYTTDFQSMYTSTFLPKVSFTKCVESNPCPAVVAVSHELLGDGTSSARISWTASEGDYANSYSVVYADSLITDWTNVNAQIDSIQALEAVISGLNAYTDYYVYVIAHCDGEGMNDGSSQWSEAHHFKTLSSCLVVNDFRFETTSKTSALATWSAPNGDNNFVYVLSTSVLDQVALETATTTAVTDTFLTFENLTLDETYYLYVAHNCGAEEGISPYLMDSIHTSANCPAVANLHAVATNANTVQVAWDNAEYGEETEWEVGVVGRESVAQRVLTKQALVIGLEADMDYTIYVKAICSESEQSALTTLAVHTPTMPADEISLGSGNGTSSSLPINLYYKYSTSMQIYTAEEIGGAGLITSVSMKYVSSTPATNRDVTIYLKHIDRSTFDSSSDWETMDASEIVFDGTVSFVYNDWTTFTLDSPFDYNGTDNLLLVVDDNTGSYITSSLFFATYTTSGYQSMYYQSDGTNMDPTSPSATGTQSYSKSQILLGFEAASCPKVKSLKVEDITINSANISWLPGSSEVSWATVLSASEMTNAQLATAVPDTMVYKFDTVVTGLTPDTDYHFYVRSLCSNESSDWAHLVFATLPTCSAPVALAAKDMTDTTAVLTWKNITADFAGTYELAIGTSARFNLTDTTTYVLYSAIADTTYMVSDLTAMTQYIFAVREHCSDTDNSRWSRPYTFRTECALVKNFPWLEDFSSFNTGNLSEACWVNEHVAGTGTSLFTVVSSGHNGSKGIQLPDQQVGNKTLLALPVFDIPEDSMYLFSLDINRTNYSSVKNNEGLEIYVSKSDTLDNTARKLAFIPREYTVNGINAPAVAAAGWYNYEFMIPEAGVQHIIILGVSEYGSSTTFDNLKVRIKPTCNRPVVDSVSTTYTSAELHVVGNSISYLVELSESRNFVQVDTLIVSSNVISFSQLAAGTNYYVRVTGLCDDSESEPSEIINFTTKFCIPFVENFANGKPDSWSYYTGLASDIFAGAQMTTTTSGWTIQSSTVPAGMDQNMKVNIYGTGCKYWMVTPTIDVSDTTLANIRLTFDAAWTKYANTIAPTETSADDKFIVAVSTDGGVTWNINNAYIWANDGTGNMGLLDNISERATSIGIDLSAYLGGSITIGFYGESTVTGGDNDFHVDNVVVNTFNANCLGVENVVVSDITFSSATVNFDYLGTGANNAVVEVSESASFAAIVVSDTLIETSTDIITGLEASTTYYVRVKQLCGGDDESAYSMISFTTSYGTRFEPIFASTTAPEDWKSTTGTAEDAIQNPAALINLTGWNMTDASSAINAIHFKANVYGSTKHWLVSPSIDLSPNSGKALMLSLDAALTHWNMVDTVYGDCADDRMVVMACVDDSIWTKVAEWNNNGTGDYRYDEIPVHAARYYLNFTDYAGYSNVRFAVYGESTVSGADNDLHVGNFVLDTTEVVNISASICDGKGYSRNGFNITKNDYAGVGVYHFSRVEADATQATGMKIVLLELTVNPTFETSIKLNACLGDSVSYGAWKGYAGVVGTQTYNLQNVSSCGCDSIEAIELTVTAPIVVDTTIYACEEYEYNGKKYYSNAFLSDTTTSVVTECDSIYNVSIQIGTAPTSVVTERIVLCAGSSYEWNDSLYTTPGTYTAELVTKYFCDSTAVLEIMLADMLGNVHDTVYVEELPYVFNGEEVLSASTPAGSYTIGIQTTCGTGTLYVQVIEKPIEPEGLLNAKDRAKAKKVVVDGLLYLTVGDRWYDAQGRAAINPLKEK